MRARQKVFHSAPVSPIGSTQRDQHTTDFLQPFALFSQQSAGLLCPPKRRFRYRWAHDPFLAAAHRFSHRRYGSRTETLSNMLSQGDPGAVIWIPNRQESRHGSCLGAFIRNTQRLQTRMVGIRDSRPPHLHLRICPHLASIRQPHNVPPVHAVACISVIGAFSHLLPADTTFKNGRLRSRRSSLCSWRMTPMKQIIVSPPRYEAATTERLIRLQQADSITFPEYRMSAPGGERPAGKGSVIGHYEEERSAGPGERDRCELPAYLHPIEIRKAPTRHLDQYTTSLASSR